MKKTDILIIGSGGAGLSAALRAKELGAKVTVVGESLPTRSQTSMAQGGINAPIDPNDSIQQHIADTLKASHGLASKEMVTKLINSAPSAIEWLNSIGVPFSRKDEGTIAQRRLGGASFARACYSQDYTGLKILHTLYDQALHSGVEFVNESYLVDLIVEENQAKGAIFWDLKSGKLELILSKKVILATGGFGAIYHGYSTNANGSTGDGIAAALRVGAKVGGVEFVQFHPTALKGSNSLISESARGAGGYLLNSKGERFVDELKPRDEVARAIWKQMSKGEEVYLDIRHLGEEFIDEFIPQERKLSILYAGIDPVHSPMPINPVAHYTMGGILVDEDMQSSIKSLYAVGEAANAGVHGANRLGGNSLLEIVAFGRVAGESAVDSLSTNDVDVSGEHIQRAEKKIANIFDKEPKINFYTQKRELGTTLYESVGIIRDENRLQDALATVRNMRDNIAEMGIVDRSSIYNTNLIEFLKFENSLLLSEVLALSALHRKESRGAHFRSDFESEDETPKETIVSVVGEGIEVELKEVEK